MWAGIWKINKFLRYHGDVVVAVAVAGSLIVPGWPLVVLSIYLGFVILTSLLWSIPDSFIRFTPTLWRKPRGIHYNYIIAYPVLFYLLLESRGDTLAELESPLKVLLLAYTVMMNVDRHRWSVLIWGVAAAACVAFALGFVQTGVQETGRAEGATNAVRFGMLAVSLASVAAVGVIYADDRLSRRVALIGCLAGIAAAFLSGSRAALLSLPILLLIAPLFWQRSRHASMSILAFLIVLIGVMFTFDIGKIASRVGNAYHYVVSVTNGEQTQAFGADGDRLKMLTLAWGLFRDNPWFGVGAHGWNEAVAKLVDAPDPADRLEVHYNEAHNQYADDLAKGGVPRFLMNAVILLLPLLLFAACRPYRPGPGRRFALAGLMLSAGFIVHSLNESMVLLNLPFTLHTILVLYLLSGWSEVTEAAATSERVTDPDAGVARAVPA
jgi:O-antigen ligase